MSKICWIPFLCLMLSTSRTSYSQCRVQQTLFLATRVQVRNSFPQSEIPMPDFGLEVIYERKWQCLGYLFLMAEGGSRGGMFQQLWWPWAVSSQTEQNPAGLGQGSRAPLGGQFCSVVLCCSKLHREPWFSHLENGDSAASLPQASNCDRAWKATVRWKQQ